MLMGMQSNRILLTNNASTYQSNALAIDPIQLFSI